MKYDIWSSIEEGDLIDAIAGNMTHEQVMGFILRLDLRVADYDFTKELIDKLTASLKAEDEATETIQ